MDTSWGQIQLWTTKANQLITSGTRFFGENLTTDLKLDGQKELKNVGYMLFPRFLAMPNFEQNFQYISCARSQDLGIGNPYKLNGIQFNV